MLPLWLLACASLSSFVCAAISISSVASSSSVGSFFSFNWLAKEIAYKYFVLG